MTFTVNSYATHDTKSKLTPYKLERRDVHDNDVLITIDYAGICHSDLHTSHNDWGNANFPLVPGHEIVGRVEKVGSAVKNHKVGDVVAVGCLVDSCGHCEQCNLSHETFCAEGSIQTYNSPDKYFPGRITAGGYSEQIVVQEHFVLKVPETLQSKELYPGVAPILCAGITSYSPLKQYNVGKGSKVAVIGLGGLGHMGVKLARALGAEVTVVSRSHKKDSEAKELGAHKVVASSSEEEMKAFNGYFDLMLDTIPWDHDVNMYMPLVKPYGALSIVGYLGTFSKSVSTLGLIFGDKKLSGSAIGGIEETQELLDLCARERIIADYEMTTMDKVNEAWEALDKGDTANRIIIDIGKFRAANKASL